MSIIDNNRSCKVNHNYQHIEIYAQILQNALPDES